jgi:hypothetical protein
MTEVLNIHRELSQSEIDDCAQHLGPGGVGAFVVRQYLQPELVRELYEQLESSERWMVPTTYFEDRPNVVQDYAKIALILTRGDQGVIDNEFPALRKLVTAVDDLAISLSTAFPLLERFRVNDIDLHHYPEHSKGLGAHKDYPRNTQLITVNNVFGSSRFGLHAERDSVAHTELSMQPGDVLPMRAPGLYADTQDIRPFHSVVPDVLGRMSIVLRQDEHPDRTLPYGLGYDNWPDGPRATK